jgi:ABC-type transport system involved in multi-copper enzyme maturation permease subunit
MEVSDKICPSISQHNSMETIAEYPPQSKLQTLRVQTLAIFVDAFREMNAKRLFWIALIISNLVAAAFGAVGINQQGLVIFWKTFPSTIFNTQMLDRAEIYKVIFTQLGVNWWLTFIATILALVSTAGIFPEFLTGGAVDLYLSKPIGRLRLFLTKYLTGLTFVALQVLCFCISAFFVIGLRGNVWEPAIFIAVPFVLLFYSYLFAVMVLLGVLTRSVIASLLLTIIFWVFVFAFHQTEVLLLTLSVGKQIESQSYDHQIDLDQQKIDSLVAGGAHVPALETTQPVAFNDRDLQMLRASIGVLKQERAEATDPFANWHRLMFAITYPLPKTTETIDLIKRTLGERMHLRHDDESDDEERNDDRGFFRNRQLMRRAGMETQRQIMARSETYILGTSLGFEVVVVGLSAWIFCRRDF